jgi:glycerol-3-phosphate acyltransferase PlsY
MEMKGFLLLVVSYLLGSIPSGYVITKKLKGIDIRHYGSGNPGAANVYRTVGRWAGWLTLILDALKGYGAIALAIHFYPQNYWLIVGCATLAIFGHMWTIFLNFKGGKGVATSAGIFAAMLPLPTLISFAVFATCVAISGHISVGSIVASLILPILSFTLLNHPLPYSIMATFIALVVLYKHIPNIKRLMSKKELAFKDGSQKDEKK